jgi:hypothetical protein
MLSAADVKELIQQEQMPLALTVRRVAFRSCGERRSRAVWSLADYSITEVVNCMLCYPQDAHLQSAGCGRLSHAVVEAGQRGGLQGLLDEVRRSYLMQGVINAMEVHVGNAEVLTAASQLLACLAKVYAIFRANVVGAGVLPALCAGLRAHDGPTVVHALCDLVAELCSARGALTGSRRAVCESIAETGTHKAVLRALRGHVGHQGVVAATCQVLLAFQEEYEGSGFVPSVLSHALRSQDTIHALEAAQQRFAHSTEIQLGAEWAVGVGRHARERQRAERAERSGRAERAAKPPRTPAKTARSARAEAALTPPSRARVDGSPIPGSPAAARRAVLQPVGQSGSGKHLRKLARQPSDGTD